jgi:hypothetical protein
MADHWDQLATDWDELMRARRSLGMDEDIADPTRALNPRGI